SGRAIIKYCNITYVDTALTLFNSSFNDIMFNEIMNNEYGIFLLYSSNNNISNNNIKLNNISGIGLYGSNNNMLLNNTISYNEVGGIVVTSSSSNNIISGNNLSFNLFGGIDLYSSSNTTITHNDVFSNTLQGIFIYWSSGVNITNNTISSNSVGIKSWSSSDNWIHHNNIVDNADQAEDDGADNHWDDGSMGNYWSDYEGVDNNNDGIGDSPYIIDEDTQDNFPLMNALPDTLPPSILLISPANNSIIRPTTKIDFLISDFNIDSVEYTINSGTEKFLAPPYDIPTTTWADGTYTIEIYAKDSAGNENMKWFVFTIDAIKPAIVLNSPANSSLVASGTIIDLSVFDTNLDEVRYSINGGAEYTLDSPFDIDTAGWSDGDYTIEVTARDMAGNEETKLFVFTFDNILPTIISTVPADNAADVQINTTFMVTFSESMRRTSVESALYITPTISYSIQWSDDNRTVILTPNYDLQYDETYEINIGTNAKDFVGHELVSSYNSEFTTEQQTTIPDSNDENTDDMEDFLISLFILVVAIIIVGILLAVLLIAKKRKEPYRTSHVPTKATSHISPTSYQHITQFQCPRCNQIINIDTIGGPPVIQCPYCGLRGTIK
ncbi:MAG: NosD domain-containing protein, partial [Thermoplasmata archaeon]